MSRNPFYNELASTGHCAGCQHYNAPGMWSGRCVIGGLDPAETAKAERRSVDALIAYSTVNAGNSCPRFEQARRAA